MLKSIQQNLLIFKNLEQSYHNSRNDVPVPYIMSYGIIYVVRNCDKRLGLREDNRKKCTINLIRQKPLKVLSTDKTVYVNHLQQRDRIRHWQSLWILIDDMN